MDTFTEYPAEMPFVEGENSLGQTTGYGCCTGLCAFEQILTQLLLFFSFSACHGREIDDITARYIGDVSVSADEGPRAERHIPHLVWIDRYRICFLDSCQRLIGTLTREMFELFQQFFDRDHTAIFITANAAQVASRTRIDVKVKI